MGEVKQIACIGGKVIGSSWAVNFSMKGYPVTLTTTRQTTLEDAKAKVEAFLDALAEQAVLTADEAQRAKERVSYTTSIPDAVRSADFIQENTPDNLELKQQVLAQIEENCPPHAIIASSTSNLSIKKITEKAQDPARCIGAHPFNPPHLVPLVEISQGNATDEVVKRAVDFYKSCGKAPAVLRKDSIGFIANRLQMALYREAVDLVTRGVCSVEDVDNAVTFGPGMRWSCLGPNMLYQLGGGENGLKGLLTALKTGGDALIADLADWKVQPENWPDVGQQGVWEEMEHMPEYIGHTDGEIAAFRDQFFIQILKMHHRL